MTRLLALPALALVTTFTISTADARPMMAGISAGLAQSELDADTSEPDETLGLFGRIGLTNRLGAQLEVGRAETQFSDWKIRKITALLVVDLRDRGPLVPVLLAGMGVDESSNQYGDSASASHIEGGFGLEYRATGGLTLGADVRMGGRSLEQSEQPVIALYAPMGLRQGEYRTARITLGVRF